MQLSRLIYLFVFTSSLLSAYSTAQPTKDSGAALATTNTPDSELQNQRFAYKAAKNAIKKKHFIAANSYIANLEHYPLTPYLEYQLFSQDLNKTSLSDIDVFLRENSGSLLADKLKGRLLYFLATQKRWSEFNHYYTQGFSSAAMQCRSLLARYHTNGQKPLDDAVELWAVGRSQPDACDPLFKQLKSHGLLTDEVHWKRFNLAMLNRKYSLARYIQQGMSADFKQLADTYFKVHQSSKRIANTNRFSDSSRQTQDIISYGIRQLSRSQPQLAWSTWEKYEASRLFDAKLATETKRQIVKYLTRKGHLAEAEQILSYSHSLRDQKLIEQLLRENLENQDWPAIIKNISLLDSDSQLSDRWQYWSARAHEALGSAGIDSQSTYRKLAHNRSWYGFLSADRLGLAYQLVDASQPANTAIKSHLSQQPVMRRAKELWTIGEYHQARMEWHYALKEFDNPELIAAGELAKDWGWYNSGIVAMIRGNLWDHLNLRFPLAFSTDIENAANQTQLDNTLIYAIARQESAFASDAVSRAGARGLMQLMPATAKQQAKHSGIRNHKTKDLLRPEHNITLGSAYLDKLINDFNGNRILATAAYNAGPHRVKRWLPSAQTHISSDIWVETIPFKETRHYVQNVLTYSVIYAYRMGNNSRLLREAEAKITL